MQSVAIYPMREDSILPTRATPNSAGLDLYTQHDIPIFYLSVYMIRVGFKIVLPEGYEGQIRLRSSMAFQGLSLANGVGTIDSDYRGEVCVLLRNHKISRRAILKRGNRIAQLIIAKVEMPNVKVVIGECPTSERGEGGFGSTGK
jgi:dUTP pyrophosphatase